MIGPGSVLWMLMVWCSSTRASSATRLVITSSDHYSDVIMSAIASQTTGVSIVDSTVCLGVDQRKHQSSASLAFVRGIHQWPLDSPQKGPVARKMLPFDDVTMHPRFSRCQRLNAPPSKGLPYIPRVHLSEGSLVRSPLKWLWSEEPMVRRSFIPKFLYSESCYVPKIPSSERPSTKWILCYEDSLVRSSSSPKGAMFRTSIFRKSPLPHTGSILRRSFSPKFPQF